MTHEEMIEAVARAIGDTTDFDGDRMASRYADSELRDMARAAIRVIAPAVLEEAAKFLEQEAQYWPDVRQVQELIQAGAIGEIITARAYFGNPAPAPLNGPKPWRYELAVAGGGVTIDGGAHWLRPLRMWLGEVDEVVAVTGRLLAEMEGESFMRSLLRFQSGVVAVFDTLYGGAVLGTSEEFRVTGTLGEVVIERGTQGRVLLFTKEQPDGQVLPEGAAVPEFTQHFDYRISHGGLPFSGSQSIEFGGCIR